MTAPRIIALSGPKYSGKDTAASALLGLRSMPKKDRFIFCRMPFAQGVKNTCQEFFGWDQSLLEDPVLKETKTEDWPNIEPRWPMMDIANWLRDKYGGDIHVRRNSRLIQELHRQGAYWAYVITDWRFPEETEWLESLGTRALKIYIQRDEAEERLQAAQKSGNAMALNQSEMHYANTKAAADRIILNNDAIHDLQNAMLSNVRQHFGYWYPDQLGSD